MIPCHIQQQIKEVIPDFKIGIITYNDITVGQSPKMLKGRFQMFQEELKLTLAEKHLTDFEGIKEWRNVFKKLGTDPSRYRPSQEALYRRLKKGQNLTSIHSAVDVNNLTSLQYQLPLGIYDLDHVQGSIEVVIGSAEDGYEAINGRYTSMEGKLTTRDSKGAFGSPIVDSLRTMVTEKTSNALHIIYIKPSMHEEEAPKLVQAIGELFTTLHGGTSKTRVIS